MGQREPRVDAYIEKSPEYAQPILRHLREVVHKACPMVEEAIKWNCPFFMYKGMLCMMAGFKKHVSFGIIGSDAKMAPPTADVGGAGNFVKVASLKELPADKELIGHIKAAMKLKDAGIKPASKQKEPKQPKELVMPPALTAALKKNKTAQTAFAKFSPSHQREYADWIAEAKTDATREKRIATALEWIAEGKPRNWKYMRK